jgi:hypothetical protein
MSRIDAFANLPGRRVTNDRNSAGSTVHPNTEIPK